MRSGDERKPRLRSHAEAHRRDAVEPLDTRRQLGVELEVAAQNQLGFAAPQIDAQAQLAKAALLALHASLRAELATIPDAQDIKTILVTPGQMGTDMFHGLKTPSNFLAPILSPAEVAKSIMGLIERGESGQVALPLYSRYAEVLATLPVGVQALIRRWSGVDTAIANAGLVQKVVKEKR